MFGERHRNLGARLILRDRKALFFGTAIRVSQSLTIRNTLRYAKGKRYV